MSSIPPTVRGGPALSQQDSKPRTGHHVRAKDLFLVAALVVTAYLVIAQLADIGFGTIAHELREAEPAWLILGLILAQCTFVAGGIAVRGTVTTPLALLPCVLLQSAIKFVNLTVPSSAGRIGMNLRFLRQLGVPGPQAAAAGAIDDVAKKVVQIGLLLLVLPLVNVRLDTTQVRGPDSRLVAALGVAIVVTGVVILSVPKFARESSRP
jgi:lysylphosphatidylglycerol synthase-like protein